MNLAQLLRSFASILFVLLLACNGALAQGVKKKVPSSSQSAITKQLKIQGQVFIVTRAGDNKKLALVTVSAYRQAELVESFAQIEERDRQRRRDAFKEYHNAYMNLLKAKTERIKSETSEFTSFVDGLIAMRIPYSRSAPLMDQQKELIKRRSEILLQPLENAKKEAELKKEVLQSHRYFIKSLEIPPLASVKSDPDGLFELTLPAGEYIVSALAERSVNGSEEFYEWLVKVDLTKENRKIMLSNDNLVSVKCDECVPLPVFRSPAQDVQPSATAVPSSIAPALEPTQPTQPE